MIHASLPCVTVDDRELVEQTAERQAITSQPEGRLVRTGWPSFAIFWKFYAATLALHGVAWK